MNLLFSLSKYPACYLLIWNVTNDDDFALKILFFFCCNNHNFKTAAVFATSQPINIKWKKKFKYKQHYIKYK